MHGSKPGPKPYLLKAEEESLADFLVETAKAGYGKSRQQVLLLDDYDYHNNNDNNRYKGLLPSQFMTKVYCDQSRSCQMDGTTALCAGKGTLYCGKEIQLLMSEWTA